jgi:hypothetical protein
MTFFEQPNDFWHHYSEPFTNSLQRKKPTTTDKAKLTQAINSILFCDTVTLTQEEYFYHALVLSTMWIEHKVVDENAHKYASHLLTKAPYIFGTDQRYFYYQHTVGEISLDQQTPPAKARIYLTKGELCLLASGIYQKSIKGVANQTDVISAGKSAYLYAQTYFSQARKNSHLNQRAQLGHRYFDVLRNSFQTISELYILPCIQRQRSFELN